MQCLWNATLYWRNLLLRSWYLWEWSKWSSRQGGESQKIWLIRYLYKVKSLGPDRIRFELPQRRPAISFYFDSWILENVALIPATSGSLILTLGPWSWTLWILAILEPKSETLNPWSWILTLDPTPLILAPEVCECLLVVIVVPMGGGWLWGAQTRGAKGPAIGPV